MASSWRARVEGKEGKGRSRLARRERGAAGSRPELAETRRRSTFLFDRDHALRRFIPDSNPGTFEV